MKSLYATALYLLLAACGTADEADMKLTPGVGGSGGLAMGAGGQGGVGATGGMAGGEAQGGSAGMTMQQGGAAGMPVAAGGAGGKSVCDETGLLNIFIKFEIDGGGTCVRNNAGYNVTIRTCGAPMVFASISTTPPRSIKEAVTMNSGVTIDKSANACDGRALATDGKCTVQMGRQSDTARVGLYVCAGDVEGNTIKCDLFNACP